MFDIDEVPLNDDEIWDMICEGEVKGCFQIESNLGKTWCKEIQPRNIEELSGVVAAIRPGSLKSKLDGKSMTKHYADRKNGKEEVPSLYPSIDEVIKPTYGIILYQEQSMKIAQIMAGFDLKEADNLRKAISKKDAKLMKEMGEKFMAGCAANNVPVEKAQEVFDIIEKSNRYSFNKCITEDSLVELESGEFIEIKNLKIGQKVRTPSGLSTVKDKFDHGEMDMVEITLSSGKSIKCTLDHKYLCESGEIKPLWKILIDNDKIVTDSD
jgi:DNA polymerase-3 subunit alpha